MTETVSPYDVARPTPVPQGVAAAGQAPQAPQAPQISDAGPRATMAAGQAFSDLAQETDRYGLHIDTIQAQDALNKIRTRKEELAYGPNGFMSVKGGEVLNPNRPGGPLLDDYKARFQSASDDIVGKLSPRARQMVGLHVGAEANSFKVELAKHTLHQTETYEVQVLKDGTTQDLAEAARYFQDPDKIAQLADRSAKRAASFAASRGIPAEGAALAAGSNVRRVAVESLLASGNNRQALTYYDGIKDKLDGPDATALQAKLKGTATEIDAENAVNGYAGVPIPETAKRWDPLVQRASAKHGVEVPLAMAVLTQESRGNPTAVSPAGAGGLMQMMPGTAKEQGVADVFNPEQNVDGGVGYLKKMLVKYNGNERLALMGYNWGPGNTDNWIKTGSDPEKIPLETRGYLSAVQGFKASFGGKMDVKAMQLDLLDRPDLTTAAKTMAYALIEKRSVAFEAFKTASIKQLDGQAQSVLSSAMVDPASLAPGTLSAFADQYKALGDPAKETRFRLLASMEGTLKTFATSATDAQRSMLEKIMEGLPKQVAEGFMAGDNKARAEAKRLGGEKLALLQKSIADGIQPAGLAPLAKEAAEIFAGAGDHEGVRKVHEFYSAAFNASAAATQPGPEAQQTLADLQALANKGQASSAQLETAHMMKQTIDAQAADLKKDAFTAGTKRFADVGAPPPLNLADRPENVWQTLDIRSGQARKIEQLTGVPTIPFTDPEIADIRAKFDAAAPAGQAMLMKTLVMGLPVDMIPRVAAAIAGKNDTGDTLSRHYAAAMALYADGSPASSAVADQVLRGAEIIKSDNAGGRKVATTGDAWLSNWQDQTGNALQDLKPEQRALVKDAITAIYTYQMHRAGKQGEKSVDTTVMDGAMKAVLGEAVTVNGQQMFPPQKGMTRYEVEDVLGRLQPGDLPQALRTREGDEITADLIKRQGRFTNVAEGLYKVRVPDPRRGGDLAEVEDPKRPGQAWLLDMRTLIERAPVAKPNTPDYVTGVPSLAPRRAE